MIEKRENFQTPEDNQNIIHPDFKIKILSFRQNRE